MRNITDIFIFFLFFEDKGAFTLFFILKHQFFRDFQLLVLILPIVYAQNIKTIVHGIRWLSFFDEIDLPKGTLPQSTYNLKVSDILFGCFINFQLFC